VKIILVVAPEDIPRLEQAGVSWRVLGFTLAVGLASSVVFGLVPALRAAGPRLLGTLREGARGSAGGRDPLRAVLVAAEVALAIALLVASGLFIRSAWLMQRVDPGFKPKGVLTARLLLPAARYPDGPAIVRAYETIRDEAARIPGVASASIVSVTPMSGSQMKSAVTPQNLAPGERPPTANMRLVSSNYFATMGIRILAGHDISRRDVATSPGVLVINEALARRLWPTADPREALGKRLQALSPKNDPHYYEVVGVVSNLHDAGLNVPPQPEFYAPITQTPELIWPLIQRSLVIVLRGTNPGTPPESFVKPLRRVVASTDPLLPLADSRTMESFLRSSLETARMNTVLLSTLGAIALFLAMAGIYGVVSYFVSQRTQEIGVRMALGASPRMIWAFVVRRGLAPIVLGLAAGVGLSLLTTTVIRQQLYGVGPHDPATFIAVSAGLLLVALVATYAPARRAMRVAPAVALNS
jgi:predicted permease